MSLTIAPTTYAPAIQAAAGALTDVDPAIAGLIEITDTGSRQHMTETTLSLGQLALTIKTLDDYGDPIEGGDYVWDDTAYDDWFGGGIGTLAELPAIVRSWAEQGRHPEAVFPGFIGIEQTVYGWYLATRDQGVDVGFDCSNLRYYADADAADRYDTAPDFTLTLGDHWLEITPDDRQEETFTSNLDFDISDDDAANVNVVLDVWLKAALAADK